MFQNGHPKSKQHIPRWRLKIQEHNLAGKIGNTKIFISIFFIASGRKLNHNGRLKPARACKNSYFRKWHAIIRLLIEHNKLLLLTIILSLY